jgi:tetratricopeptide (TPR) repeat protein
VPVSSNFGMTFLQGNNPRAQGTYTAVPGIATNPAMQDASAAVLAGRESGGAPDPGGVARAMAAQGAAFIRGQPLAWLGLEAKKAALALGGLDVPLESSLARERRDFLPLLWLLPLGGTAVLLLAALGIPAGWRAAAPASTIALAQGGVVLLFFAANRYLLPFHFLLIPLAAAGILALLRRPFPRRNLLKPLPVALCALSSLVPLASPYMEGLYASRLMALHGKAGDPRAALAVFDRFRATAAPAPELVRMAAKAQSDLGDRRGAEATLRAALALDPDLREMVTSLAYLLRGEGREREALALYRGWLARHPGDPYMRTQAAELLLAAGDPAAAEREARETLASTPFFPAAHLVLGSALLREGREAEGLAEVGEAIRQDPRYAAPHFALGLHALEKGDLAAARGHLLRAQGLGFPLPPGLKAQVGMR